METQSDSKKSIFRMLLIFLVTCVTLFLLVIYFIIIPQTNSVYETLEQHFKNTVFDTRLKTFDMYINNRMILIESIAENPTILNAVLEAEGNSLALNELLADQLILDQPTSFALLDITGDVIFKNQTLINQYSSKTPGLQQLLENETNNSLLLSAIDQDNILFTYLVPVLYNKQVEGVLIAEISTRVEDIFGNSYQSQLSSFNISQNNTIILNHTVSNADLYSSYSKTISISPYPITLTIYINDAFFIKKRNELAFSIAVQLFIAAFIAFYILVLLGKRMLVEPYRKLKESEDRFQRSVLGSTDGIWDWNIITNEVFYSPRFKELLGYSHNEFSEYFDSFLRAVHPEDREYTMDLIKQHLDKQLQTYDVVHRLQLKTGEYRWFRSRGLASRDENNIATRMAGSISDITPLKEAQQRAEQAKQRAIEASYAKSDFLATMSHEIRTPLNGIIGLTQVLLEANLPEEQHQQMETLKSSGDALLTVINDILDFSRIESGKLELESFVFDLEEVCCQTIQMLAPIIKDKNLPIILDYDQSIAHSFIGDPARIKQILINLINNAIKFTEHGFVKLHIKPSSKLGYVLFEVFDTGIGISPEHQAQLFQPFSQADSSTTRKYGGTGLGLTICKKLVEKMNGHIKCSSQENEGTKFWFEIKIDIPEDCKPRKIPELNQQVILVDTCRERGTILGKQLTENQASVHLIVDKSTPEAIYNEIHNISGQFILILNQILPETSMEGLAKYEKKLFNRLHHPVVILENLPFTFTSGKINPHIKIITTPIPFWQLNTKLLQARTYEFTKPEPVEFNPPKISVIESKLKNKSILVVDDTPINVQIIAAMLRKYQVNIDVAENGQKALEKIQTDDYDLVLMDCLMPIMDGYEATKEIRKNRDHAALPIIALTANASSESKEKCLSVGMDDFIPKPFRQQTLIQAIERWCKV